VTKDFWSSAEAEWRRWREPERSTFVKQARELVELARHYGYRREDVIEMIADLP
jgi:hypothetical protein